MSRPATWLSDFRADVYSQRGEDGVIRKILEVLPKKDRWCVEFGAWDGRYLSNTRNLIENEGYSAVLIEGSKSRFRELKENYAHNRNVVALHRFVGFDRKDNLDHILQATPIPKDFDFLSIDIDGNDYHVWQAATEYRPKVVCIEFNPTIPTQVEFVQPADPSVNQGSSLLSLVKLGADKGYELVSVLPFNALFVRAQWYPLFGLQCNSPEALRTDTNVVTYLFSGFDGKVFLSGDMRLPWHAVKLRPARMQHLPWFLRKYPGNYGKGEKLALLLYRAFWDPRAAVRKLARLLTKRGA